ncbi:hypothetical protein [Streptosporangium sp. NPDC048865]|uniref:hypothetical protein n=1 Tax=Streptosporangium sp. NPDC048865 TaxID=3155766 RepID=UPI00343141C9
MSRRHALHLSVLHSHLTPYLRHLPFADREALFSAVAEGIMTASDEHPTTVLHRYVHGPNGCRQQISNTMCALTRDDEIHKWPFGDTADVPERIWHVRRWTILNPAAPTHAFDDINPVHVQSWSREDWGTTGDDVVIFWGGRFSAFYGGWDADAVAAAWQADRDRLAAAGGFAPLPFGPKGKPDEELAEPPHRCDTDYCCWD